MSHLMLYENAFLGTILAATAIFFVYRKLFGKNPISLVKGWNTLHKRWSTWLGGAGAWLAVSPDKIAIGISRGWGSLPADLRGSIPPDVVQGIGIGLIVLGVIASIIKQPGLTPIARPGGPLTIPPIPDPGSAPAASQGSGAVDAPDGDGAAGLYAEPSAVAIIIPDGAKTS